MTIKPTRHLLGISGGKDSAALAIYMRDRVPEMEYFFADTGAELPETLEFVDQMEAYLGKPITRINGGRDFEHYLKLNGNNLPTAHFRWCTASLKLKPFEEYVGSEPVISYVAIRADEQHRTGYISTKPNITARYPFKEDGLDIEDVKLDVQVFKTEPNNSKKTSTIINIKILRSKQNVDERTSTIHKKLCN